MKPLFVVFFMSDFRFKEFNRSVGRLNDEIDKFFVKIRCKNQFAKAKTAIACKKQVWKCAAQMVVLMFGSDGEGELLGSNL